MDDHLGDVVVALPMFAVLRTFCPDAELHLLCQRYVHDLVDGLTVLDKVHFVDAVAGGTSEVLRSAGLDAIFLPRIKDIDCWRAWRARIPLRIGTGYRWYSFLLNHRVYDHRSTAEFHEAEYNTRQIGSVLGESVPTALVRPAVSTTARQSVMQRLLAAGVGETDRIVILHPGSRGNSKDWSPELFGALGARLGLDEGIRLVVTGVESERAKADAVMAAAGANVRLTSLVGQLTLAEMIALIDRSALIVVNATGVLHVAASLGTPVLGLYPHGPASVSPARWRPYSKRSKVLTPPASAPADMTLVTVDAAAYAARELLASGHTS